RHRQERTPMSEHAPDAPQQEDVSTQFRLVTTYGSASKDAADENQRRIDAVFAELAESAPDNVTYLVLRLADDPLLHVSFPGHAACVPSPRRRCLRRRVPAESEGSPGPSNR